MQRGSYDRLSALYASHATGAIRLAYSLTGHPEIARDIANEAFVRIASRLLPLRAPEEFSAYLYRTVVNLARSHGRRRRRERTRQHLFQRETVSEMPDLATREALWRALLILPIRQRTAIFLRYYEDLSESEAAGVLNCSVSAVKSLTFRALEALRKELQSG